MDIHQNRIIKTKSERVEVKANPGSGKTSTLVQRLLHLHSTGVPAEKILVLSFSNRSVGVINKRIEAVTSNADLSKVTVSTAHSFARGLIGKKNLLGDKQAELMLGRAIRLVRQDCKKKVLWPDNASDIRQRKLKQLEELHDPFQRRLVLGLLAVAQASRKKVADLLTGRFVSLKPYARVLRAIRIKYSAVKKANGVVDYGDMLVQAAKAIESGAEVPFTHILVDEYQDCSAAQTYLLALLAKLDISLMVFGDSKQGVFGFAGTSYIPLSDVLDGVKELTLPKSYRLTAQTAALASAVAGLKAGEAIKTEREGALPVLVCNDTHDAQTKQVVADIQKLIKGGTPPNEIVVLGRLKALVHPVEQMLRGQNIDTSRLTLKRDRKHVIRVLKLVRIVERCKRANQKALPEMLSKALSKIKGVDDAAWKKGALELNKEIRKNYALAGLYQQCAKIYVKLNGGSRANKELLYDVNRWDSYCRGYQDAASMRSAICSMPLGGVVTGTIHAAKGDEWNHVFIVGATDGQLPIYKAKDESAILQERNLMYVAITRARDRVRLYHAPIVEKHMRHDKLSRFLKERAVKKTLSINDRSA